VLHKVDIYGQATVERCTLRAVASSLATWTEGEGTVRASKRGSQIMGLERSLAVLVSLVLLILGLCVGCGEPPPVDMSLLTGDPCEPPCWQGLTPGECTEDDVSEFLQTSKMVNRGSVFRGDRTTATAGVVGVSIQWRSTSARGRAHNSFAVDAGVLNHITIYPDYDLTLERLIGRYGPPEKYISYLSGFERQWVDVTLYYPTHGFTVYLLLRPDDATLKPESKVASIWYFRAAPLERFLQLGWEAGYFSSVPARAQEFGHDWQGYARVPLHY